MKNLYNSLISAIIVSLLFGIGSVFAANANTSGDSYADTDIYTNKTIVLEIDNPNMIINGETIPIDHRNTEPILKNENLLMPLNVLIENIGGVITWEEIIKTSTISYRGMVIQLTIDSPRAYVNGEAITLLIIPEIIDGQIMLPVSFVLENLGFSMEKDANCAKITISNL